MKSLVDQLPNPASAICLFLPEYANVRGNKNFQQLKEYSSRATLSL